MGKKLLPHCSKKQARQAVENLFRKLLCRNKTGDSTCLELTGCNNFSLICPLTAFEQTYQSKMVKKTTKYQSALIFLCARTSRLCAICVTLMNLHVCTFVVCSFFFLSLSLSFVAL